MIHYSCDICGRTLNAEAERRYVVKMEVRPTPATHDDPVDTHSVDDMDPLEILEQLILDDAPETPIVQDEPCCLKYDLCCDCQKKFLSDPLGRKARFKIHFSAN